MARLTRQLEQAGRADEPGGLRRREAAVDEAGAVDAVSLKKKAAPPDPSVSRERAERANRTMSVLLESPDVFETFFDQARIGLALADLAGRYIRVNKEYADLLGRPPEEFIGVSFVEVLHPADRFAGAADVRNLLSGAESAFQYEQRYVDSRGGSSWLLHGAAAVPGPDGTPAWFAVSAQDITERRRAEEDLRALSAALAEQAVRDPLTGLANRTLFEERLKAVLARDSRTGASSAVLFLDLDGFKEVNDNLGHAAGDEVLCTVAERLAGAVRPSDTVARIGGDEFVVLMEGATEESVANLVSRLRAVVGEPMETLDLEVGVSVGAALAVSGGRDPEELLSAADQAMYAAKHASDGVSTGLRPTVTEASPDAGVGRPTTAEVDPAGRRRLPFRRSPG